MTCLERDPAKADALQNRALQADIQVATIAGDATQPVLSQHFDRVLIDAPCSGTGVVGRHPEARWRKRPDDGERLARTQSALLEALVSRVHSGGAIVYAVCSTDPRETTGVIEPFARSHNVQVGLVPARFEPWLTQNGEVLLPPGLSGRDGFFIARLERRA